MDDFFRSLNENLVPIVHQLNNEEFFDLLEDLAVIMFTVYYKLELTNTLNRNKWISDLFLKRNVEGLYATLWPLLVHSDRNNNDRYNCTSFIRMNSEVFYYILGLIKEEIEPKENSFRPDVLSSEIKLVATLRFLATGETYESLQYQFRIASNTLCVIVPKICSAIINHVGKIHLKTPNTTQKWEEIQREFEMIWNFPDTIFSVDGKHVHIKIPPNSGSDFINYKNTASIVLLGIVGPKYNFIAAECGMNGRISDGGVWRMSKFKEQLDDNRNPLNLPEKYHGIGDAAFPLSVHLLRPYSGSDLSYKQLIFNYRLSRARRVVENYFGILVMKFRILFNRMNIVKHENINNVVLACCCLHNLLGNHPSSSRTYLYNDIDHDHNDNGNWRNYVRFEPLNQSRSNSRSTDEAYRLRDELADYFFNDGAVEFQWRMVNDPDN